MKARKHKAARLKHRGSPIEITGKALAIEVRDSVAWIAENTTVVRKLDLEVGCDGDRLLFPAGNSVRPGRPGRRFNCSEDTRHQSHRSLLLTVSWALGKETFS